MKNQALNHLLSQLQLERLEVNLFRGQSQDLGWGTVFGGQVLGQSLSAAAQTVPKDRQVHSLHGYFLQPGDPKLPIIYDVDQIRDGKSFTTRRVVAIQKGRAIFNMSSSFQIQEPGLEHHDTMPTVEGPEGLASESELVTALAHKVPPALREVFSKQMPIEIRPVHPIDPFAPSSAPLPRYTWFRAASKLPDDPAIHRYLLAYASDFHLVTEALVPHGRSFLPPSMQAASLDHAMWFHRPVNMDEWLLYAVDSPSASGARALARGRFFNQQGQLLASTAQEGLIRIRDGNP